MVKVFGDESCTHRGAKITAVAIYFARPENWRKFRKPWRRCLKKYGLSSFHMVDFENCDGAFVGWGDKKKSSLIRQLLPHIPKYSVQGLSCAILDSDTLRSSKELAFVRKEFHQDELPYLFCFLRLIKILGSGLTAEFAHDRMAFVFEENQFSWIAMKCYWLLKKTAPYAERLASITFCPKDAAPELQAADVLAYQTYKAMYRWWIERKPPEETELMHILNEKRTVGMLPYPTIEEIRREIQEIARQVRQLRQQ